MHTGWSWTFQSLSGFRIQTAWKFHSLTHRNAAQWMFEMQATLNCDSLMTAVARAIYLFVGWFCLNWLLLHHRNYFVERPTYSTMKCYTSLSALHKCYVELWRKCKWFAWPAFNWMWSIFIAVAVVGMTNDDIHRNSNFIRIEKVLNFRISCLFSEVESDDTLRSLFNVIV